eukprot:5399323-Pleurochrysis_carterae.AAC.1
MKSRGQSREMPCYTEECATTAHVVGDRDGHARDGSQIRANVNERWRPGRHRRRRRASRPLWLAERDLGVGRARLLHNLRSRCRKAKHAQPICRTVENAQTQHGRA